MTQMRELVLGGDGLIGSTLVRKLTELGGDVRSLDLKSGCDLRTVDDQPFREADRVWFLAWDTGGARYIEAVDRQHEQYKHNCELPYTFSMHSHELKHHSSSLTLNSPACQQPMAQQN